jgi:hypothetical protein
MSLLRSEHGIQRLDFIEGISAAERNQFADGQPSMIVKQVQLLPSIESGSEQTGVNSNEELVEGVQQSSRTIKSSSRVDFLIYQFHLSINILIKATNKSAWIT